MPKRITTLKEAQIARKSLAWCYICGKTLDGTGEECAEHVIPKKLWGTPPRKASDQWGLILNAHKACEKKWKHDSDEFLCVLLRTLQSHPNAWAESDRPFLLRTITEIAVPGELGNIPIMKDLSILEDGVWTWVRGLHASIHREFLPAETARMVLPPVPRILGNDRASIAKGLEQDEQARVMILGAVEQAWKSGLWDGLSAWGNSIRFYSAWVDLRERDAARYNCMWMLHHDGVPQWSRATTGISVPWHGMYKTTVLPPGACLLEDEALSEVMRVRAAREQAKNVQNLLSKAGR